MIRTAVTYLASLFLIAVGGIVDAEAQQRNRTRPAQQTRVSKPKLASKTWSVNGQERTALVYVPPAQQSKQNQPRSYRPLIFGFHGHGGTSERMVNRYRFHELWPEAIVVYPQGLKTVGKTDPQGKKPGWQNAMGIQEDRDLAFFDAMLQSMIDEHGADPKRIYLSGHSNGAGFSYLLLTARNSKIAAIGVSAGGGRGLRNAKDYEARPVLHIAGRNDSVVPFSSQERTIKTLMKLNHCEETPTSVRKTGLRYPSKNQQADIIFFPHNGTHAYPEKAPELIITFLKRVSRQTSAGGIESKEKLDDKQSG